MVRSQKRTEEECGDRDSPRGRKAFRTIGSSKTKPDNPMKFEKERIEEGEEIDDRGSPKKFSREGSGEMTRDRSVYKRH
jgi:hypothetical protein